MWQQKFLAAMTQF